MLKGFWTIFSLGAPDNCRLRTNVLPSEEGFNQAGFQENIPQELLKYLKQQILSSVPLLPAMQEKKGNMEDVLSRNNLRDDEKARRYFQLQNKYLAFKEQLNTSTRPEEIISGVWDLTPSTQDSSTATTAALSTPLNPFNVTPELTQLTSGCLSKTWKRKPHPSTTLKSCFSDLSSHTRNPITTRPEAQKASDSNLKLLGWSKCSCQAAEETKSA